MASSFFAGLPKFRRGAFALFVVVVILSAVLGDQPVGSMLLLHPEELLTGRGLWQPLTANFIYPEGMMTALLGTFVVQWFIGSDLEGFWGTRRYVLLTVGCGVVGYLSAVALAAVTAMPGIVFGGATGMDLAAVAAFGVVFGKRPLRVFGALPLNSRTLAILVIAISIIAPLARGAAWQLAVAWLVSVGAAVLATTQPWRRLRDSGKLRGSKSKRKRGHLKVVRPDRELLN